MSHDITIAAAKPSDVPDAVRILLDATAWMKSQNFHNWLPEWWTNDEAEAWRAKGELFMAKQSGANVAMFCLQKDDEEIWPEKRGETDAFYIHRVTVARDKIGLGIPALIMDWCKAAAKDQGIPLLRLDCADRPKLVQVYSNLGFEPVGRAELEFEGTPTYKAVKMELKV